MLQRRILYPVSVVSVALVMMLSCFGTVGVTAASGVINDFESPVVVTKLKGNAGASRIVEAWICHTYQSQLHQWVENAGLKALLVEIYEGMATSGNVVLSEYIVFADHGAYPSGTVQLPDFQPAYGHLYNLVLTPYGHKDMQASYFHDSEGMYPPQVVCTITQLGFATYQFDATQSYDTDGSIVSYSWTFQGELTSSDPVVIHTFYGMLSWSWSVIVTDNDGLTAMMFGNIPNGGPV